MHQEGRIFQCFNKVIVGNENERRLFGDRQYIELCFGKDTKRSLRTAQKMIKVFARILSEVIQIVASNKAIELREMRVNCLFLRCEEIIELIGKRGRIKIR